MPAILALDDDLLFCEFVKEVLVEDGHIVATGCNGQEGLDLLGQCVFDLILTDIDMPVMDGIEFWRSATSLPNGHNVPFVVLTGRYREQLLAAESAMAVLPFLQKPATPSAITNMVRAALNDGSRPAQPGP